ncbi:MAG: translation initiation factor, partial [Terrimicrobiaceae bacterium]
STRRGHRLGCSLPLPLSRSRDSLREALCRRLQGLLLEKNGRVVLRREKARRGGKTVVVVSDFAPHISDGDIETLARQARQACGCGGTLRGREVEMQGDSPEKVRSFFEKAGFRVAGV